MIYAPATPHETDIPAIILRDAAAKQPTLGRVVVGTIRTAPRRRAFWAIRFQAGREAPAVERLDDGSVFTPVGGWRS